MPKEKFTAGPYVKSGTKVMNKQGYVIADCNNAESGNITGEEKEANAQLISASTDMYNFIRDLYESAQRNGADYPALVKIYNKALGINP